MVLAAEPVHVMLIACAALWAQSLELRKMVVRVVAQDEICGGSCACVTSTRALADGHDLRPSPHQQCGRNRRAVRALRGAGHCAEAAEEGVDLTDLRATTRDLMRAMEADLGTKLDWIAVDHHNTGHPHTHMLLRGVTDDGKTLNIAGDYIAHGIRERASEIVTLELGRQTEQDVTRQLEREVDADRFTRKRQIGLGL